MYMEQEISYAQAALGAEVEVPTLDGKVKLTIPEGTQPGAVFRLRGKGIPFLRGGGRGDQFVSVKVGIPKKAGSRARRSCCGSTPPPWARDRAAAASSGKRKNNKSGNRVCEKTGFFYRPVVNVRTNSGTCYCGATRTQPTGFLAAKELCVTCSCARSR